MNYLAHFYLANYDEGLIVGNLMADHVKGAKFRHLPENVQRGVILHRKIDDFTDNHPEVEKTKLRLREKYRKYAPVISDVFYDYILGKNWMDYSNEPLKEFTGNTYQILHANNEIFPTSAKITLGYMSKNDWLYHYSTYFGIGKALEGLSRRAKFETNMHEAVEDLKKDYHLVEKEFRPFFKELQEFVSLEIPKL